MATDKRPRCSHEGWNAHCHCVSYCRNAGTIEEGGVMWCKIHAPSAVQARKDLRDADADADLAYRVRQHRIQKAQEAVANKAEAWAECQTPHNIDALLAAVALLKATK